MFCDVIIGILGPIDLRVPERFPRKVPGLRGAGTNGSQDGCRATGPPRRMQGWKSVADKAMN